MLQQTGALNQLCPSAGSLNFRFEEPVSAGSSRVSSPERVYVRLGPMLSAAQQNALSPLAQRFLSRLRGTLPGSASERLTDDGLLVRVEPLAVAVGPLEAVVDDEVTIRIGDHTHSHIAPYLYGQPSDPEAVLQAAEAAVEFLADILGDRVVIWSRRVDGQVRAGGSYHIGTEQRLSALATEAWLWSGRAIPIGE